MRKLQFLEDNSHMSVPSANSTKVVLNPETAELDLQKNRPLRVLYVAGDAPFFVTHFLGLAKFVLGSGGDVHLAVPVDTASGRDDRDAVRKIEESGVIVHRIGLKRSGVNPFADLLLIKELNDLITKTDPSLLHCLGIKPILYAGAIARLKEMPAVHSVIGLGLPFMKSGVVAALSRSLILFGFGFAFGNPRCKITVEHEKDRETIERAAGDREITQTTGVGVDLNLFHPPSDDVRNNPPVVMFAARLIESKGIRDFVEAARRLKTKKVAARFVLQCQFDLRNKQAISEQEVEAWHKEGVIEWWGQTADMPNALRKADIFCLPTFYREGTPKALLEAAASGLPIITSNIAGCRDVVSNGQNGILVAPRRIPELEAALETLITDEAFRRKAGSKSRELAEENFCVHAFIRQTTNLYSAAATKEGVESTLFVDNISPTAA